MDYRKEYERWLKEPTVTDAEKEELRAIASDEKEIAVHSDFRQGYFTLRITNPVFEKVEIRSHNQVETSKADKGMHGFGVANIVRTAKKYGGDAALSAENGIFTLEVGLWLNPEL